LRPRGHPDRSSSLNDLAKALQARFVRTGVTKDLNDAIEHLRDAIAILPIHHPMHAKYGMNLASLHFLRHDFNCAFGLFESAANHETASPKDRLTAALQWASLAQDHRHESTVRAYSTSLILLDRCLVITPTVELQQKFLANTTLIPRSLASQAASSAIERGQLEIAVELLDQGRAILWSKMRGYRHPLEKLRESNAKLADEFERISRELEHHVMSKSMISSSQLDMRSIRLEVSFEQRLKRQRALSEQWDEILEKIRSQIDGFADFLQAVPFCTLQSAAAEGPVIIVNLSEHRSDAIIVHRVGPPILVPLSGALPQNITLLSSELTKARASGDYNFSKTLRRILRALWKTTVCPVKDQLTMLGIVEKSRIWWCPTSEFCALPLHAAGPYLRDQRNLPDIYISSYTTTLSALITARRNSSSKSTIPKLLIIGQPGKSLPKVQEELHVIQQLGSFVNILVGEQANCNTVLSGLQEHSWAHFACHGHLDSENQPFHSSFELYNDMRLTLLDLMMAKLPDAEFAFLSACHSAASNVDGTPDEVIHLAAALQFSGFRSVIGTLWAMSDIDGPEIARDFYKHMFRQLQKDNSTDFKDSAEALNVATRAMRLRPGMTLDRWINFIHIGA